MNTVDIVCMEQSSPEVDHLESAYLFMTPFLLLFQLLQSFLLLRDPQLFSFHNMLQSSLLAKTDAVHLLWL